MKMRFLMLSMIVMFMTAAAMGQLAGYWTFDDDANGITAADSSGNGKTGTLQKTGSGSLPQWITGHNGTGGALLFNSDSTSTANVKVVINTTDGLAQLTKTGRAFTISLWVRSDALVLGNWRYLVYTNAYDLELAMDPNNYDGYSTNGHDYFYSDVNAPWQTDLMYADPAQRPLGVWTHMAITFDGNYIRKYVNGRPVFCFIGAPLETQPTATTNLFFASMDSGSGYFVGALDDVAIWSSTYLPESEIVRLANDMNTPLTVHEHAPEAQNPVVKWELERGGGWNQGVKGTAWWSSGWAATWSCGFAQQTRIISNAAQTAWCIYAQDYAQRPLIPGTRSAIYTWCHLVPEKLDANTIYEPNWSGRHPDVNTHGIEWIDNSWSGVEPNGVNNVAKLVGYITPGYAVCGASYGYTAYDPCENRFMPTEDKPYFKTYARFSPVNAPAGSKFFVKLYTFPDTGVNPRMDANCLTYFGELAIPIVVGNHQWQEFKGTLPKPGNKGGFFWNGEYGHYDTLPQAQHEPIPRVWFELSIQGGNPNTMLYIDEFAPISDQYIQEDPNTSNYRAGDVNKNSLVYWDDIQAEHESWLAPYDFLDYADTTRNWLLPLFNNISGHVRNDPNW